MRRYKRFLADVELEGGEMLTIHCPNTGSMKNCLAQGEPLWYSTSASATRKYPHTWEIATTPGGFLAGINTNRANKLVLEAIESGLVDGLNDAQSIRSEVRYGEEGSRIDFLLEQNGVLHYVEVKNVTLAEGETQGYFPDAVSIRATKHMRELTKLATAGHRATVIYCVQHTGITTVAPADHIDPLYGAAWRKALAAGVKAVALTGTLSPSEIRLTHTLPVVIE